MTKHIIFIQVQARPGIIEAEVIEAATVDELRAAIEAVGVALDAETHIFLDEAEEPLHSEHHHAGAQAWHACACQPLQARQDDRPLSRTVGRT
ncbi:hypothetical protein [Bradyrhizobium vignae]|uniref:Uncharacterized protein n=1 Tax=Bradyrhizobium vignae TaxID=1549949 RepID=A0ABS4A239_9BRAD|nr:hypothetical protein [Bradyrhizobium vignae]MBP0114456.1 hypothetical protein [Bradyrhizobium vignae]